MITKGIIKEIKDSIISVEMFDEGSSCSSGNCASCSSKEKNKILEALNTKQLPIKTGSFIEMELSTAKALIAAFRVLIIPLLLFISGFMIIGSIQGISEGLQVAGGFTGLGTGFLFNLLFSKKYKLKEMPEIVRIL
ncbi:MAG: SoxR reducing system RseC family protein [Spirochaetia bacterium]|jgi:positive regulator of sigma E activity|nr:SoxR reducing system RseC family protein [Spirochaetia bacterium]